MFVVPRDVRYLGPFLIQVDEHVVAKASHLILRSAAFGQDLDMTDPLEPPREGEEEFWIDGQFLLGVYTLHAAGQQVSRRVLVLALEQLYRRVE